MLIIFFLMMVSLFIPFFWFIAIAYITYLITTKKSRRNKMIMDEIVQSIALQRDHVILDYICFDSAKSFAFDHGACPSDMLSGESYSLVLNIAAEDHQIRLQRCGENETRILLCAVKKEQQRSVDELPFLLKNSA